MSDSPRVPYRGLITASAMLAMFMQTLDSTIANVALPYMPGSMSASYDEITWVLTSYVIAAAKLRSLNRPGGRNGFSAVNMCTTNR